MLSGGAGADLLQGGAGRDAFRFGTGFGQDVILDFQRGVAHDFVDISGYTAYQSIAQVGGDVLITFSASDSLLIRSATVASITSAMLRFGAAPIAANNIPMAPAARETPEPPTFTPDPIAPIIGTSQADNLAGNLVPDDIRGLGGADHLDGRAGADRMIGGAGDDTYVVDNAGDQAIETSAADGIDLVLSSASFTLGNHVENLTLTSTLAIDGTGNALANILIGNAAANILDGRGGADAMQGGAGNDTYVVDHAGDVVTEAASAGVDTVRSTFSYTLGANVENLTLLGAGAINGTGNALANILIGNAAANQLNGGDGSDQLDGAAGADTMTGGLGSDNYAVDNALDKVIETNAAGGTDLVHSAVTFTLGAYVENLALTGNSPVNGTGNNLANILIGNGGANIIDGGAGTDAMDGGAGNDTYVVDNAGDSVTESNPAGGTDLVNSSVGFTLGANVENLRLTGTGAVNGTGNGLANILTGNAAANILSGGAGADEMRGAAGNDTYVVDNALDLAIEAAGAGTDRVTSSVNFTLGGNVENLILASTAAINGTGNTLANMLTGNGAANILNGGLGADTMQGGLGNDSYFVDNVGDRVVETSAAGGLDRVTSSIRFALGTNVEILILTGSNAINGTGNGLANSLTGNDGANTLNGAGGADTMSGGLGNDRYGVDNVGDVAIETSAAGGNDLVTSTVTFTLGANIENLVLVGTAALGGTGNSLANLIVGNAGANLLDGKAGADTMQGGLGHDTYAVDNVLDKAIETSPGGGTDLVRSSVSFTLGSNVENLTLLSSAGIDGTGNNGANTLTGNSAANILKGLNGNDVIDGGAGNDQIHGGAGHDSLNGGTGADAFLFNTLLSASTNLDHILDFVHAIDEIRLENAVFTTVATGALSATAFRLGTTALDADDRILYDAATGNLFYDRDGTGGAAAVQFASLDNMPATLNATDFLVI